MDLRRSADDIRLSEEVREFLATQLPDELRARNDGALHSKPGETLAWQKILHRRGWGAPHWPKRFGGTGWTPYQRLIFDIECARAGAPWINQQGMGLLGPVVNEFGTDAQRKRFIEPLISGETFWAQGFSEPGSGSDLASLSTSARREEGVYIVDGQKIWTSHARYANWMFLLARTSHEGRKQEGISFLVLPVDSPGVTVRPIDSIDGLDHLHEVFFDEVRVPADNLIGREGQGWDIAKYLLGNERVFGACDMPGVLRDLARLEGAARDSRLGPHRSHAALTLADHVSRLRIQAELLMMAVLKAISTSEGSSAQGWSIGSILKVRATELHQQILALLADVMGVRGAMLYPDPFHATGLYAPPAGIAPDRARVGAEVMYRRAVSIHGGTNEIQRDLIARSLLA